MARYEYREGSSQKFWEIEKKDKKVIVRFGRIGSKGQEKVKSFKNSWEASNYRTAQIKAKTRKGYALLRPGLPGPEPTAARDPELEAMIAESPGRPEAYEVYGDWLLAQGDPRGELIAVENALRRSPQSKPLLEERARLRAPYEQRLRQLAEAFGWVNSLGGHGRMTAEWELGFIRAAKVGHDWFAADSAPEDLMDVRAFFLALLSEPSLSLIRDLSVGLWRDSGGQCSYAGLFAALGELGLPALRRLFVGDFEFPEHIEISWTDLGDVSPLYAAAPRLEELTLQGGAMSLGRIDCPALRSFDLRTGGLSRTNIQAITAARWPRLERLDVWFGDHYYGFDGSLADIEPLLAGENTPGLRHLGLKNCELTDAICARLPTASILPRLESLDLSMGMMTDEGAAALAAARDRLRHLRLLDVSKNFLTPEGERLLRGVCGEVVTDRQKEPDVWEGEVQRFVSVGE